MKMCCSQFKYVATHLNWMVFTNEPSGEKTYALPHLRIGGPDDVFCGIRTNFCPACGGYIRDIEVSESQMIIYREESQLPPPIIPPDDIPLSNRVYLDQEVSDDFLKTVDAGDNIIFEMPSFVSGDYTAKVYADESGRLYIDKEDNHIDSCRTFEIEKFPTPDNFNRS